LPPPPSHHPRKIPRRPNEEWHSTTVAPAPLAAEVRLDDTVIAASAFTTLGSSGYKIARLKIKGGSHSVESSREAGISVYGVGSYTSYMYPGGLDLKLLLD